MSNSDWLRDAKLGIMVHFGLYSLYEGEYRGKKTNEWARYYNRIPRDEYHRLAEAFNPIYFDADEWIRYAKEAGAKYFVITAKHHDGFALFDSKASDFNVVKATPFKRDIIKEIADACKKYDIKLGLYYSQDLDWDEPDAGGFIKNPFCNPANNTWDYNPTNTFEDFQKFLDRKVKPQITEMLTNYGDICQIWFDNPWTVRPEHSKQLRDLVKNIQPDCLCGGRIGNGYNDIAGGGDNSYELVADKVLPTEAPVTLAGEDCWCFSVYNNTKYKSAEELLSYKKKLNDNGVTMLLNVGPDHLGRFPDPAVKILQEMGRASK